MKKPPHRVRACVDDMAVAFGGERTVFIARELTKLHEELAAMPLAEAGAWFDAGPNRVRGEFVLIVHGAPESEGLSTEARRVLGLLLAELPLRSAVRLAAEITGAERNGLYSHALALRR